MELRTFAAKILQSESIEEKLSGPVGQLTDIDPGPVQRIEEPKRPAHLKINHSQKVKVPKIEGMADPAQRARIIHALANHELQAVELFAWAILAFPEAPSEFRRGLLGIIIDEQKHFRLYQKRLRALGVEFGDHPVTCHFWTKIPEVQTPLEFACTMGLTFENANLDFAQEYAAAAMEIGDTETARALDVVHRDEIRHVRFGWRWLDYFKEQDKDHWQAYNENVTWPLGPSRARGASFDSQARKQAGFSDSFIEKLRASKAESPGGSHR